MSFADRKMWDSSWDPLVHPKFLNHVFVDDDKQHLNENQAVLLELDSQLDFIIHETDCRVIILTGMGKKSFIAGADIQEMHNMNENQALEFSKMGQDLTIKMEEFKIPIIAAVNGFALGGGCELAMACHIRYAAENSVYYYCRPRAKAPDI